MTTNPLIVVVAVALGVSVHACGEPSGLRAPSDAPSSVQRDCALAETRCSRCHSFDRVIKVRVDTPKHWQSYVHRMRLQPQSGISAAEEPVILRCLMYRSFGRTGATPL